MGRLVVKWLIIFEGSIIDVWQGCCKYSFDQCSELAMNLSTRLQWRHSGPFFNILEQNTDIGLSYLPNKRIHIQSL